MYNVPVNVYLEGDIFTTFVFQMFINERNVAFKFYWFFVVASMRNKQNENLVQKKTIMGDEIISCDIYFL